MTRIAYYEAEISEFLAADENALLGILAKQHGFALEHQQKHAWVSQFQIIRRHLPPNLNGWIYFEFSIPRMGKRVDVLIVTGGIVFVIEFKVGAHTFDKHAIEQAHDYALDLKTFIEAAMISQSSRSSSQPLPHHTMPVKPSGQQTKLLNQYAFHQNSLGQQSKK